MKHRNLLEAWHRLLVEMGTPASGHWGHASKRGVRGGSIAGKGGKYDLVATKLDKDKKRVMLDGKPLPKHVAHLRIPPAWTQVRINPDPKGALLVKGRDAAGRSQAVYSEKYTDSQSAEKFARVKALERAYNSIVNENERNRKSGNPALREDADCLRVVMQTGIRPGSAGDTRARVKAYGATTLEGRHVVQKGGEVRLEFVGKKGVPNSLPITDGATASMLLRRAGRAGASGKLFSTDSGKLSDYSQSLHGGAGFKTKDFRTRLANEVAAAEIRRVGQRPTTLKEYKSAVKAVAKTVAARLGNTATVCLQSYINPVMFSGWRLATQ